MVDQKLLGRIIKWVSDYEILFDYERFEVIRTPRYSMGTIIHITPTHIDIQDCLTGRKTSVFKLHLTARIHSDEVETIAMLQEHIAMEYDDTPYDVYILYDDDDVVHYVGMTKDMNKRYQQHCKCVGTNLELNIWIQSLLRDGKVPHMQQMRHVTGRGNAERKETYLITHYLREGVPLKNILKVGGIK